VKGSHLRAITALSLCAVVLLLASGIVGVASATTTYARGSAYGAYADLSLLPLLGEGVDLSLGPTPLVDESYPPTDFNESAATVPVDLSTVITGDVLSTGVLSTATHSDVANDTVFATAQVDGLGLYIVELIPLLTIDAGVINSTADHGDLERHR
jgi:hypothetical protein